MLNTNPNSAAKSHRPRVRVTKITNPDYYDIFRKCRRKNIIIRGNTDNLKNILDWKSGMKYKKSTASYARKFLDGFLYSLGRTGRDDPIVNEQDCVTSCHISDIPKSHYFEVSDSGRTYIYDIRTLNAGSDCFNHFTHKPLDDSNLARLSRKIYWMKKYGYPVSYQTDNTSRELSLEQLTTNVINHINQHHYINRQWFDDLTLDDLKDLYINLNSLWVYRLPISDHDKVNIMPPDGVLCPNTEVVRKYTDHMVDKLRRELLLIMDRMTGTELGSIYFMLGLVTVSDNARTYYPDLYKTLCPDE